MGQLEGGCEIVVLIYKSVSGSIYESKSILVYFIEGSLVSQNDIVILCEEKFYNLKNKLFSEIHLVFPSSGYGKIFSLE